MKKITLLILTFFLSLVAYSQGISENFDSGTGLPTDWVSVHNGTAPAVPAATKLWKVAASVPGGTGFNPNTAPNYAYSERYSLGQGNTATNWLITKQIQVPINGQIQFNIRQFFAQDQLGTKFQVKVSKVSQDTLTFVNLVQYGEDEIDDGGTEWEQKTIALNATTYPPGSTIYVAFVKKQTQGDTSNQEERYIFLDDVRVNSKCVTPISTVVANSVTLTSAQFSWSNASNATKWEIVIAKENQTLEEAIADPTLFGIIIDSDGVPTLNLATITPAVVLTPDTNYKYYVRAVCAEDNKSDWADPTYFKTKALGESCAAPIVIPQIGYSVNGNTANSIDGTDVSQGAAAACGAVPTGTNYMAGHDVFYTFTAPTTGEVRIEMVPGAPSTSIFVYNTCANVGVSCIAGVANNTAAPRIIPALSVTAGQSYIIVLSAAAATQTYNYYLEIQYVTCAEPTNLAATVNSQTNVDLSWTNPFPATEWEYVVQPAGASIPTVAGTPVGTGDNVGVTTFTTNVSTGLVGSTSYQYWVRSKCTIGGTTFSPWAGPFQFFTPVCDPATTQICNYEFILRGTGGWRGALMHVIQNGVVVKVLGPEFTTGNSLTVPVPLCHGIPFSLLWVNGGTAPATVAITVNNSFGQQLYIKNPNAIDQPSQVTPLYTKMVDCQFPDCLAPTNVRVSGTPTANSITVTWNITAGTSTWEVFPVINGEGTAPDNAAAIGTGITTIAGQPPITIPGLRSDTDYRFYVRTVCGNDRKSDWVMAAALIRTLESCKYPALPVVVSTTRTSANFSWTQGALNSVTPTSWQVVVQAPGAGIPPYVSNAPIVTSNATPPAINVLYPGTLQSGTRYEYYVRAYCGDPNNVSRWVGPIVFTTLCDPLPVPYSQGFNTTSDREFCWTILNNGGANAWSMDYATTPSEGDQVASILPNNGTTNDDWLISPTLTLLPNYRLRFKYKVLNATAANKIEIKLSTTGNSPVTAADFTETLMVPTTWNNTQYVEKIIYFSPASAGQQINVGWHLPLGEDNRNRIYIDDVVFEPIPVCPVPTFPIVENITSTSADLSWTAGYQETQWQVVVQPVGTGVPATGVTGVLTTDNEDYQVTTNYLGQALQPGTVYEYYVRAYCNATDQSQWIGPIPFKMLLCEVADKCAFIFTMRDTGNNPWQSTMSIIQNGEVVATLSGPLQGQATRDQTVLLCPGVQYSVFWNTESTVANAAQVGLIITNPYNEVVFTKLPTVGFQNTTLYRGMPFCGPITCPYPTNLQIEQTSGTSIRLDWTPGGTETQWQYLVLPAGSSYPGNTVGNVVNTPFANVLGLTASVPYEVYVRAVCGPDNLSYWVGPIPFTIFNSPGCLGVDIVGVPYSSGFEKLVCDNDPCVSLDASYYQSKQTTSYAVSSIAYLPPYPFNNPNATKIPVTADDDWSPLISLSALADGTGGSKPFNFCFFGNFYDKLLVTDNGAITFSITGTPGGLYAPSNANAGYQLRNPLPSIPAAAGTLPYKNSIFGVLQDLNPATAPASSSINYQVLGTYPCRAFVMSIDHLPNYSCNTSLQTSQIVLYEGSNIIDVYVESRTPCTGQLTGGQGLIGIQGNTNTQFSVPPNRNTGTWTATREAWRFTPDGANENIQFEWRENGVPISTSLALNYCLPAGVDSVLLEAVAIYPICGSSVPLIKTSEVKVIRDLLPIEEPIDLKACIGTTTTFDLTLNTPEILDGVANAANYQITYYLTLPEAQSGTTGAITSHTTSVLTPIYVRIVNTVTTCWETRTFNLVPNEPLPDYTLDTFDNDAIICTGEGTSLEVTPINFALTDATYEWTLPDGTISTETSSVLTIPAGSLPEGVYNYSVKVDDGCETVKNFTLTVTNDDPVVAFHYTTPVCIAGANPMAIADGAPLTAGGIFTATTLIGTGTLVFGSVAGEIDLAQTPAGQYEITYEVAATTCTSLGTHSFTITINDLEDPVTSFTITNATVCSNGTVTPTIVKDAGFTEGGTFSVNNSGLAINPTTGAINLAGSTQGVYQVTYTVLKDIANCIDAEVGLPVQVTINPGVNADATFSYLKDTYCANEPSVLPNSIITPGGNFTVSPTTGLSVNGITGEITVIGSTPGDYTIFYTIDDDALTCLKGSSTFFDVTIENELDVDIDNDCQNGNYILTATPNDASYTYSWKNATGTEVGTNSTFNVSEYLTTVTSPVYPLEFTVTINNGGCDSSEKFIVPNTSCNIPKGISPNGDGDNDQFDLTGFNVRKLEIFNRYGTKVYSKSNYVKEWIGQADNGNDLPDGTYYYVIERDNVKTATGWIQINRQRN